MVAARDRARASTTCWPSSPPSRASRSTRRRYQLTSAASDVDVAALGGEGERRACERGCPPRRARGRPAPPSPSSSTPRPRPRRDRRHAAAPRPISSGSTARGVCTDQSTAPGRSAGASGRGSGRRRSGRRGRPRSRAGPARSTSSRNGIGSCRRRRPQSAVDEGLGAPDADRRRPPARRSGRTRRIERVDRLDGAHDGPPRQPAPTGSDAATAAPTGAPGAITEGDPPRIHDLEHHRSITAPVFEEAQPAARTRTTGPSTTSSPRAITTPTTRQRRDSDPGRPRRRGRGRRGRAGASGELDGVVGTRAEARARHPADRRPLRRGRRRSNGAAAPTPVPFARLAEQDPAGHAGARPCSPRSPAG